ncbi:serine/threonine-protein kinase [Polyangium sp. 15x6]|uniref:serine/threonine protein kinase n=1 Tax=Polyangium sp. 15x6 TaxID=3042687 RepID=UPI00249A5F40|nr:serine/threonine-protein kinase [Polyangium sp. 15x6]MDI3282962.1 serine/threonine-protein kinase [Polyangium sp. 15x6]
MEQLGDYLVRRLVGEGGMGKVYEGEERLSKRRVALKVLHPELARSETGRKLFVNEMQILAHLEHPNVVRSLASIEANGQLAMVLEYLDGRTLRTVLGEEGRLPWTEAIRIVAAVASALSAAHGQEPPIIHRDLKPENIMILTDGTVKVMDFGIAKMLQAMNQTNTQSVGTLQYMSPEQIDARTIDHRADLYALGLVFYELLAGKPPFSSASPRQLLNLQCTAEPPPLEAEVRAGLPKGVEQLVFQLLEKAPEDRPYFAQDVVERLEPFQVAAPAPARTSPGRVSSHGATTPHQKSPTPRTIPEAPDSNDEGKPATRSSDPRSDRSSDEAKATRRESGGAGARKDTIALVDQVDQGREVPTKVAVGIIVGLSLLAGLGAYLVRSTQSAEDTSSTGAPTATVTATAKNTATGKVRGR